jgi:hypothetical protein
VLHMNICVKIATFAKPQYVVRPPLPRDCIAWFVKVISSILSIQGYSIFKMAGKSKSVMGAGQPEEIKTESGSLTEHGINIKK